MFVCFVCILGSFRLDAFIILGQVSYFCMEYFISFENCFEHVAVFRCLRTKQASKQLEMGEETSSDFIKLVQHFSNRLATPGSSRNANTGNPVSPRKCQ